MTVSTWKKGFTITMVGGAAIATVLAGCSDKEAAQTPAASTAGETAAQTPAKRGNITASTYDRGTVPAEEGTPENNRWTKWINENGPANVKFMAIPRFESQQKFNVMFASGTAPDVLFEYDTAYRNQLFSQKQLMPVEDLINKYSTEYKKLLTQYPQLKKLGTKSDGKLYEFGRINGLTPNHVLFIRNDWLKKLNLSVPKTTDELYQVAKAFAEQDPDGNGKKDTYGMAFSFVSGMIVDYTFGSIFTIYEKYPWYPVDGKLVHDWDRTKAAFSFKKKLYDEGIVDKDFLTDSKGEKAKQDWLNGKLGMYGANGGATDFATFEAFKKNNPDAEIIPIALPKSPFGQFAPAISNPVQMTTMINAGTKDPEAAMRFIDFLVKPSTALTLSKGIEGTHYQMQNGCPQTLDAEKSKKEVSYTGDLGMLSSVDLTTYKKCNSIDTINNPTATQKEFYQMKDQAFSIYLNKETPIPTLTHPEQMPALPADLQLVVNNAFKTIMDIWQKAVISGSSYTIDQALKDAMAAWEKAGGSQVDDWYAKWYAENKDKWFFTQDMYDFIAK
ncbi:extracellular solute-binding protein [Paenibacillus oryzisoli]|uniref:extracellular solute-binding protein n=1 Tax=Paenibacillus oryzisoli TaxID=1850517 RepID=UPI003D2CB1A6